MAEDVFEPLAEISPSAPVRPHVPALTRGEIDEAELQARLVLHKLNADTGERIEITRKSNGVQIKGVVESEERKQQLLERLRVLPLITSSISTFQDMKNRPGSSPITSIQAYSVVAQPSPLEKYLAENSWGRNEVSQFQQQLLNASVTIHQQGKAITELFRQFEAAEMRTEAARSALNELLSAHRAKLIGALDTEQHLIDQIPVFERPPNPPSLDSASLDRISLSNMTERNFSLCTQLTSGSDAPPQVRSLVSQLSESVVQLHVAANMLPIGANFSTSSTNEQE